MKLQLAFDTFSLEQSLAIAEQVRDYVDIFEMGTPFILEYGMETVRRFRETFPDKTILADLKIMDAGELEAAAAFEAGADEITVLAVTDLSTVKACVETAEKFGGKVIMDMICVADVPSCVARLEDAGVHGIAVHTGVDQQKQGRTPLDDLQLLKACCKRAEVSVAGGIKMETLPAYMALNPDVVIVGGAIGNASDPAAEARRIYEAIHNAES